MRKLLPILLLTVCLQAQPGYGQTTAFRNAIHAKINFLDYGYLYNEDLQLSQGFEVGYFRNLAPFLNMGIPFKLGLAKLPLIKGNTVTAGLDLVFHLQNTAGAGRVQPYAFAGGGFFAEDFKETHLQFPFGAGLNIRLSRYAFLNLQGEFRKALVDHRDNVQAGIGFVYLTHRGVPKVVLPPDADKDGTPDATDKCPTVPGSAAAAGCPDQDNDGLADTDDLCPTEAGPAATRGCPDYDNDGLTDADDDCPTEAGTLKGCPDTDGDGTADENDQCPTVPGSAAGCPDGDMDGVADKDDQCPNEPGPLANRGCPTERDTDADGVADRIDPCPTIAGPFGGCPDSDGDGTADNLDRCPASPGPATNMGCPEVKKETKERLAYAMRAVQFETAKATLKSSSFAILDEIVEIMRQYPDYKLSISGHTDNVGGDERNMNLSQARAKACYDYLIFRGITAERLRFAGFGESRPMASNDTAAGREQNRRVEFELTLE